MNPRCHDACILSVGLISALCLLGVGTQAAEVATASPKPLEPIAAILEAFKTHNVVALGEGNHGNVQGHALRLALIRHSQFSLAANDIVVEFGNSRYQQTVDRFVMGEDVPLKELRLAWMNTTQAQPIWDVPIYEEFYRAVRDVNAALPRERKLRLLLGDAPIDWDRVRTLEDFNKQSVRLDSAVADLIEREVLSKGRRALVIYGDVHFLRHPVPWKWSDGKPPEPDTRWSQDSIVKVLENRGHRVFSIHTNATLDLARLQPDIANWEAPALTILRQTTLGLARYSSYYDFPRRGRKADGSFGIVAHVDKERSPLMQDQFDAILHLGPPSSIKYSMPSPALCDDAQYMAMRLERLQLIAGPARVAEARQYCATVRSTAPR